MSLTESTRQTTTIRLANGLALDLLFERGHFIGLGRVQAGETELRDGSRPMFIEIRNPNAVELCEYTVVKEQFDTEGLVLDFAMQQRAGGRMEWMVHEVRTRYNTTEWCAVPQPAADTSLQLIIRPVTRILGTVACTGFSYQYRYTSATIPIYTILDRGTWEVGGRAVGNEIWMRNCFVPAIVPVTDIAQFHSTEWYIPSCANPNVFQFLPLQTELQGFTFTTAQEGTLLTWATEVAHVRSLLEKQQGIDAIMHFHEHCGDLDNSFTTAPMEVLWAPGALDRVGKANLYEAMRDLVHETLHSELGMRRERVTTYGQIEEWGSADMDRYREAGLPKLLAAGMRKIGLASHFENNMNTYGVSNMCCTVDYKVAETVGVDKLTAFCRAVQAAGARTEMWANTSVSTMTLLTHSKNGREQRIRFLPHEDSVMAALEHAAAPWVRNPSNAIEADHYTPSFAVMNLRDPDVHAYWMRRWREAHDEVGLEGIFLDSSFNLSSDKFHYVQNAEASQTGATADQTHLLGFYRPATPARQQILSQYRAHLELMTEMQQAGYDYCNEDLGVFGTHRHGPGIAARLDSLPIWAECIVNFDRAEIEKAGADPDDVFFRVLAYRMMWSVYWDIRNDVLTYNYWGSASDADRPTPEQLSLFNAHNVVNDFMQQREILPDETGVLYRAGDKQVLWAFTDFTLPLGKVVPVKDLLADNVSEVERLQAAGRKVYLIG